MIKVEATLRAKHSGFNPFWGRGHFHMLVISR